MSRQDDADRDAFADALALVECWHRQDYYGMQVVMNNGSLVLTAGALARICADLLDELTDTPADAVAWLREHHTGG